jgi:hypothetical protein
MRQLVPTFRYMNRIILLTWAVLSCALNASAQSDDCTIIGVQELSTLYQDLNNSVDSISDAILSLADSLHSLFHPNLIQEVGAITIGDTHSGAGCHGNIVLGSYTVPEGEHWRLTHLTMSSGGSWEVNGITALPHNQGDTEYWLEPGDEISCRFYIYNSSIYCQTNADGNPVSWTVTWAISGVRYQ